METLTPSTKHETPTIAKSWAFLALGYLLNTLNQTAGSAVILELQLKLVMTQYLYSQPLIAKRPCSKGKNLATSEVNRQQLR